MVTTELSTARAGEVAWVAGHLADLEADFARFLGEWDMLSLPGPQFLRLASRMPAYDGVMRARVEGLLASREDSAEPRAAVPAQRTPETRTSNGNVVREVAPTREAIAKSALAGVIEVG